MVLLVADDVEQFPFGIKDLPGAALFVVGEAAAVEEFPVEMVSLPRTVLLAGEERSHLPFLSVLPVPGPRAVHFVSAVSAGRAERPIAQIVFPDAGPDTVAHASGDRCVAVGEGLFDETVLGTRCALCFHGWNIVKSGVKVKS